MRCIIGFAALGLVVGAQADAAGLTERACAARVNDTPAKLGACVQQGFLWNHLSDLQTIAQAHPDAAGHPNRDTFSAGYAASVAYVAKLMREAGYRVTVQSYTIAAADINDAAARRAPNRPRAALPASGGVDSNLIADSAYGDPAHTVVVDAHLDSIFGEGMLDNASGSVTILQIALALAKTPTANHLRFVWFGGEELGLLGSRYYTTHLTGAERARIAFDMDVDVTATPNFDILTADPAQAHNAAKFPPNVVPQSQAANALFIGTFRAAGVVARPAPFGNDGTDSNSFSLIGIPNAGVLTQQDCCKRVNEQSLWGGYLGDYEGQVPGFSGGCVDRPHRWCDNLSNNDPFILELVSKATAYVTLKLAGDPPPTPAVR